MSDEKEALPDNITQVKNAAKRVLHPEAILSFPLPDVVLITRNNAGMKFIAVIGLDGKPEISIQVGVEKRD